MLISQDISGSLVENGKARTISTIEVAKTCIKKDQHRSSSREQEPYKVKQVCKGNLIVIINLIHKETINLNAICDTWERQEHIIYESDPDFDLLTHSQGSLCQCEARSLAREWGALGEGLTSVMPSSSFNCITIPLDEYDPLFK